jgi:hypothetical protein
LYEYFDIDLENIEFEWDDEKERKNFIKHGIHFSTAVKVFLDSKKLIREDEEHLVEKRYNILGKVGRVLFVVCVFKDKGIIRIISARKASEPEKERYCYGDDFYERY